MRHFKQMLLIAAMLQGINAWAEDDASKRVTVIIQLDGVGTTANVGTATPTIEGTTVTVTVAPADGYYFTNGDLTVEPATDAGNAQARRRTAPDAPGFAEAPEVTPGQNNTLTGTSTFTFDLDENNEKICYLVTANFHKRISLTGATVTINKSSFVYDGSEAKPTVTNVTLNGVTLTADDFSVSYANNVDVPESGSTSQPTVTVTGLGKYNGNMPTTFTIAKRPVTFTGETDTKTYTGSEITLTGLTVSSGENAGLVSGHTHNVTYSAKGTTVNTYTGTITAKANVVIKSGDTPVTGNYDITIANGALTIEQDNTAIVIGSSTKSWKYDGDTHKDEVYTVTYGGKNVGADASGKVFTLDTGDKITITPTAEGVKDFNEAYSKNNTYTYVLDNKNCYGSVTANVGTLSINKTQGSMKFAESEISMTYGDAPFTNTLTVEGEGTISYSSSNSKIASVNTKTGEVTALRAGTAIITATLNNTNYTDTKASFEVTVSGQVVSGTNGTSITLDADGYHIDMDETVGPGMVIPDNITYAEIIYARMLDISGKTPIKIDGEDRYLFTVCLPFDPYFNAKFYTLTGVSNGSLQFNEIEGKAKALTPYLVSTTHNVALKDAYALDVVIEGHMLTEEEKDAVLDTYEGDVNFSSDVINPEPVDGYQLKGTLRGLTNADAAAEGAYILQSDGRWGAVKDGKADVYIPPFRAYIVGATQNTRTLDSSFGSATGIERIVTVDRDGTERWYDLQGRRIERPATRGIYIHNGRKEAMK